MQGQIMFRDNKLRMIRNQQVLTLLHLLQPERQSCVPLSLFFIMVEMYVEYVRSSVLLQKLLEWRLRQSSQVQTYRHIMLMIR